MFEKPFCLGRPYATDGALPSLTAEQPPHKRAPVLRPTQRDIVVNNSHLRKMP